MWFGHDQFSKTELPGRHMASVRNRFYWPDGRVSFSPKPRALSPCVDWSVSESRRPIPPMISGFGLRPPIVEQLIHVIFVELIRIPMYARLKTHPVSLRRIFDI